MKSKKTTKMSKGGPIGTGGMAPSNTPPKGAIPSKKMGGMTKSKMKMGGAKKK